MSSRPAVPQFPHRLTPASIPNPGKLFPWVPTVAGHIFHFAGNPFVCHTSTISPASPFFATDPKMLSRNPFACHTCDTPGGPLPRVRYPSFPVLELTKTCSKVRLLSGDGLEESPARSLAQADDGGTARKVNTPMNDTKTAEANYSHDRTSIASLDSLRDEKAAALAAWEPNTHPELQEPVAQASDTADQVPEPPAASAPWLERNPLAPARPAQDLQSEFVSFLKRTWKVWAIVAGAIFSLIALTTVEKGIAERARIAREARQEHAVASVTADSLLSRCGPPSQDDTRDLYPVIMRSMVYQRGGEKFIFEFSRTAEEKSDWVFLSMKDAAGTKTFDTPQAKIAALPCLGK